MHCFQQCGRTTLASALTTALSIPSLEGEEGEDKPLVVWDTPALIPERVAGTSGDEEDAEEEDEASDEENADEADSEEAQLSAMRILMRNQGAVQRIKSPEPLVQALLSRVAHPEDLMLAYNTPAFGSFAPSKATLANALEEGEDQELTQARLLRTKAKKDADEFLVGLARVSGRMKKVSTSLNLDAFPKMILLTDTSPSWERSLSARHARHNWRCAPAATRLGRPRCASRILRSPTPTFLFDCLYNSCREGEQARRRASSTGLAQKCQLARDPFAGAPR